MEPVALHDRFWASRGVQIVRAGEHAPLASRAKLYLLTDSRTLTIFRIDPVVDMFNWAVLDVLLIRLRHRPGPVYRETPVTDVHGNLLLLRRTYKHHHGSPPARAVLVRDPELARLWQRSSSARGAWRQIRRRPWVRRHVAGVRGVVFDRSSERELAAFVKELVKHWHHPASVVPDVRRVGENIWAHRSASISPDIRCIGPVWVGAGREIGGVTGVLGPAAIWDAPGARPVVREVSWESYSGGGRHPLPPPLPRPAVAVTSVSKRMFDFVFACMALLMTLPIYPVVMLAIWLEDGRPFFFAHQRETLGGGGVSVFEVPVDVQGERADQEADRGA